jgi:hypothetical protein
MTAIANLAVYDGESTPVLHTLLPVSVARSQNGSEIVATWRENLSGVPVDGQVTAVAKISQLKSGVFKTEVRVELPVMESISGPNSAGYTAPPKVAYVDTVVLTGFHSARSTQQNRVNARCIAKNLLGGLTTTQAVVTDAPVTDLFDLLTPPT